MERELDAEPGAPEQQLYDQISGGNTWRGQLLLLAGAAGVGKSRLARLLPSEAARLGAIALWGAAYEQEKQLPYGPFVEALQTLVRNMPAAEAREYFQDDLNELARLLLSEAVAASRRAFDSAEHDCGLGGDAVQQFECDNAASVESGGGDRSGYFIPSAECGSDRIGRRASGCAGRRVGAYGAGGVGRRVPASPRRCNGPRCINRLSRARRSSLHGQVAAAIESLYGKSLDEFGAVLAHHYSLSLTPEKSVPHLLTAARHAASVYANEQAIPLFQDGIERLHGQDGATEDVNLAVFYEELADVQRRIGAPQRSTGLFIQGMEAAARYSRGILATAQEDWPQAVHFLREALEPFESLQTPFDIARTLEALAAIPEDGR